MASVDSSIQGQVVSLHLSVAHREPNRLVERATFLEGLGIEGDRHATTRAERRDYQVLLIDRETLDDLDLAPGVVRENVTTSGIELGSLGSGRRLGLGDQVVLEISKPSLPCSRMDEVRRGLRQAWRVGEACWHGWCRVGLSRSATR